MKTLILSAPDDIFDNAIVALCGKSNFISEDMVEMEIVAKKELLLFLRETIKQYTQQQIRNNFQTQLENLISATDLKLDEASKTIELKIEMV